MSKMSEDIMAQRIHFGFTGNQLKAALLASTGATFLATMFGEWYNKVGWTTFSFNGLNAIIWQANAKGNGFTLSPDFSYFLGMWAHYSQGIFFGLLFTFFIYANLPGSMSVGNNLLKGVAWGVTLWVVSSSYIMPLLYGSGFLFSVWGYQNLFYNLVWHGTYGFLLGLFYSPTWKSDMSAGATSASAPKGQMGSLAGWGQVVLGWIIIIVGGYVSTSSAGTASWGVIVGLIGLIIATGPPYKEWRRKK